MNSSLRSHLHQPTSNPPLQEPSPTICEPNASPKSGNTSVTPDDGRGSKSLTQGSTSSDLDSTDSVASDPGSKSTSQSKGSNLSPAKSGLRPLTRDELESLSPEEIRQRRLAYGLQLLAQSPEYRNLLAFPTDAYSQEVAELIALGVEFGQKFRPPTLGAGQRYVSDRMTTAVRSADFERQLENMNRHLQEKLESAEATVKEMASLNLWALPVPNPNASFQRTPAYSLLWGTLPEGEGRVPAQLTSWQSEDWVTHRKGPVITMRQDGFPVCPELWDRVGLGAILQARTYKLTFLPPQG